MQESIDKVKGAAAIIQNMVSTDEEVVYNDLALFLLPSYCMKLLMNWKSF